MSRFPVLVALIGATAFGVTGAFGFEVPERTVSRYAHIWDRQPFVTPTEVVIESASLADRFTLIGVAMMDEISYAIVVDRRSLKRSMLSTSGEVDGIQLVRIEQHIDRKQSHAAIRVNGEQAVLRFGDDLAAPAQPTAAMPNGSEISESAVARPPAVRQSSVEAANQARAVSGRSVPRPPVAPRPLIRMRE